MNFEILFLDYTLINVKPSNDFLGVNKHSIAFFKWKESNTFKSGDLIK